MKTLLIILTISLASCWQAKPLTLKVIYVKNGYAYAVSSYKTYRILNDTLKRGDVIQAYPCKDTAGKRFFQRIN